MAALHGNVEMRLARKVGWQMSIIVEAALVAAPGGLPASPCKS